MSPRTNKLLFVECLSEVNQADLVRQTTHADERGRMDQKAKAKRKKKQLFCNLWERIDQLTTTIQYNTIMQ